MQVVIDLPEAMVRQFENGGDVSQQVREALAVDGYLSGRLARGQVAELLGMSFYEAEAWLFRKGLRRDYRLEDLEEDRQTLDRILSQP